MSRFRSPEHQHQRAIIVHYKLWRRRGLARAAALEKAIKGHARLSASFAVMEASSWALNPVRVAQQASQV